MTYWRSIFSALAILIAGTSLQAQDWLSRQVDSLYKKMTLEERVGQLFMIRAHSDLGPEHVESVKSQLRRYHVGGMCFFQGTPEGHAKLINTYQAMSSTPLLVAMDAEWGAGMRFREDAMSFPRQMTLGAIQDNSLLYEMGMEVGRQLREIGIYVNFAPVVDINNNPDNPVIYDRSFGEDKYNVTAKSFQYMRGMQDAGILACAKHFPGHGDTDVDSHLDLPVILHDRKRLDSLELYPFASLVKKGVESIMVAHLDVPSLDSTRNLPTTLSKKVVTDLLRTEMGFDGLVFTDALEMKGVTKHYGPGEVELRALMAGNDILCLPADIDEAFPIVLEKIRRNAMAAERMETSVKRILRAKLSLGLFDRPEANEDADPFPGRGLALKEELIENALTCVANESGSLPLRDIADKSVVSLVVGAENITPFQDRLSDYADIRHVALGHSGIDQRAGSLVKVLRENDLVIAGLVNMKKYSRQEYGISLATRNLLKQIQDSTELVVVVFGTPYSLEMFDDFDNVVMAYQDDPITQDLAAQALFGAIAQRGRLPVTASRKFRVNHGIMLPSLGRLGYSLPERQRMSSDSLQKIAGIVEEMIEEKAAPGCQVVVAKGGSIVYQRSFGHFTYAGNHAVQNDDLYDVASITKVAATTMAAMKLHDEGRFLPRQTLNFYLRDVSNTNKEYMVIRDVMAHQAGLQPWIPFHSETVEKVGSKQEPSPKYYRNTPQDSFSIQVAQGLYLRDSHVDSIWQRILDSKLRSNRRYRYSDIGFYIIAEIIERQARTSLDVFCNEQFYKPMGLESTRFRPLDVFEPEHIAPTEEDKSFRKQRLQGFVHDAGSALMGGVGGHAGIFSTAEELATLFQMLLNGGTYGGRRYISEGTIDLFTTRALNSKRRGLGFDMKNLEDGATLYMSELASDDTFGHTGFTGTCVWADPDNELIYVFLSNRTYPSAGNNKLQKLRIRERIHTLIYNSFNP